MRVFPVLFLLFAWIPAGAGAGSRVLLDRLTFCPDRRHLALEALYESPESTVRDTLLVDLSEGGIAMRSVRPERVAFDDARGTMVTAGRYTLLYGPSSSPDSARVLSTLNPAALRVDSLALNAAGDSVFVLSHPPDGAWFEISAYQIASGRQRLLARVTSRSDADAAWASRHPRGDMMPVTSVPFSDFYLAVAGGVFYLERSDQAPGTAGWAYDLHRRETAGGGEKILARVITPWAWLLSPDSAWVALAGTVSRPDYGGRILPSVFVASTDGSVFYTVVPEGVRTDAPPIVAVSMAWHRGALWYVTGDGLYRVDPRAGRSQPITVGPPPPAWSDSLGPPSRIYTLTLPDVYADSTLAVSMRERLRRSGWPAWVQGGAAGPFRVSLGGDTETDGLEALAVDLSRHGIEDFTVDSLEARGSGLPFPHSRVESPDGTREAYLSEIGPPGFGAGELWISEQHGARQVRLIRAMHAPIPAAPR